MTLIQAISLPLNLKSTFLPFHTRTRTRTQTRTRSRHRSKLRIRSSFDELLKSLMYSNPLKLIPTAVTLASGAALFLSQNRRLSDSDPPPEPVIANWVLVTSPTPFNRFVLLRCPSVDFEDDFESERLFVNLNRGKILAGKSDDFDDGFGYQRVCVRTEDGGVISLDWPENLDLGKEYGLDTTVVVVPGTGEGSDDRDVRRFVGNVLRNGCFPIVVNPRGCAGSPLTTARLFTAADSDDICTAIQFVNVQRPWTTLMGVGWGYGANMLTKYLAEVGESTLLTAAVCIDNPFDLEEATRSVPYDIALNQKLTGGLIEILRANKELFQGKAKGFDLAKALSATSVRDFDRTVSMVSYGFDTVENFYSMASTSMSVNKLKIPVLFIQSDDGTVPLYSIPRSDIAENPFTSLLLCSCHPSFLGGIERSATLWCQQLTIEWLAAVELALLKGRHPLLEDVDITINPTKGLPCIIGEESKKNILSHNRSRGVYDSSQSFWRRKSIKNDKKHALSDMSNRFLINRSFNEGNGLIHDKLMTSEKSESKVQGTQKSDSGLEGNGSVGSMKNRSINSSSNNAEDSPTDNEESQVLQTATVVLNMLDVTIPGTLDDVQKKKVLTAMEHGETLMKALEGAVPDDVRGKLTNAVTEIIQTRGSNLNDVGLRGIGWINNVTSGKSTVQEKEEVVSTTETVQDDSTPPDQRENEVVSEGRAQESVESLKGSSESSPEKASQASMSSQSDHPEKSSGGIDEGNGDHRINQDNGNGNKHSPGEQNLPDGSDIHSNEANKIDASPEQNIPITSSNSAEASSAGSSESVVVEKENDVQKNENKIAQDTVNENVENLARPQAPVSQTSSPKLTPVTVTQALEALTGFDDSTQVAVNSVFGVLENMIDHFEKANNQEHAEDGAENSEKQEVVNNKLDLSREDAKSYEEDQDNLKKTSCSLTSPVNNSIIRVKGSNMDLKNLDNKNVDKVERVKDIPVDVAGKEYWQSPYAAYLNRYFSAQLSTTKSLDLKSATDLILDPEVGHWRMIFSENGENQSINEDRIIYENDEEDIVEPSYIILDNEFQSLAKEDDLPPGKQDDAKAEFICLIKSTLLNNLKIEVGRRLGKPDLKDVESSLLKDLEEFADIVCRAVVDDNELNLDLFSESTDNDSLKFGTIGAEHTIKTISSAVLGASQLNNVLPLGVIVGSSLASLRTYFQVVALHDNEQSKAVHKPIPMQDDSSGKKRETEVEFSVEREDDEHVDVVKPINKGRKELQTDDVGNSGMMVGAFTAALGASALLAHHEHKEIHKYDESMEAPTGLSNATGNRNEDHVKLEESVQEKTQNNLVSSLAEKAMSVAGPVVPTNTDGKVDQERIVALLAELGQKGGILRLIGKFALLWGGIRGAMSLTDRLILFLHIAERPLPHRIFGFMCMVLVLWSPLVIPLLPTIVQGWTTNTSNGIVECGCIIGLYVAITILVMLWGRRTRGYENPFQHYGLELTSVSRIRYFFRGLVGGVLTVLFIHSINALLGYARLSLPSGLPSSSQDVLAFLKAYGRVLFLAFRGALAASGIATVEELLFRSWLADEIAADLGYYRAIFLSALAFSLTQRSLLSVPGLLLLSLALFGMKQRTGSNLCAPIGIRTGIMTTNFVLKDGGFLTYWPSTPFWLASTDPWRPFEGAVGVCSCAVLAILFRPLPPTKKEDIKRCTILE